MIYEILGFVRELRDTSAEASGGDYTRGYRAAVADIEDYITNVMWDDGMDDPEDE